jgi:pyruvate carboxylase
MAGLLRPLEAGPLISAIREVTTLPIHFHTHATSSASLATCIEMARQGCDIIGTRVPWLLTYDAQ